MDIPPEKIDSLFDFTDAGYEPNFRTSRGTSSISELKAAITGMEFERDYLKHCEEYVVGFNDSRLQILRHSCIYGGIRDLSATLSILAHIRNLPAYIKQTYTGNVDVFAVIRGFDTDNANLFSTIKGWVTDNEFDLPSYLKQGFSTHYDLFYYIKSFETQQSNLCNTVRGWSTGNVIDIINTIKIWHNAVGNIPTYLKTTVQQEVDLSTVVYKIWQHKTDHIDLSLHGWQEVQLQKIIQAFHTVDLSIIIRSTYLTNLGAMLYAIQPVDIDASLMGWAYKNLPVYIADGVYDGDMPINITGVGPKDLNIIIQARKGLQIIKDLNARLTNLAVYNLGLLLQPFQYRDLNAILVSSRQIRDLQVKIYPKIVTIKYRLQVSFLENRDLAAVINFPCFGSAFKDLYATLVVKHSKNLKFYIYGYDSSNIKDLKCSINASDYISQDTINIKYFHEHSLKTFTTLKYTHKTPVYSFNTINMWTNVFTRGVSNLPVIINGEYLTKDLSVFIRAYSNLHYKTSNIQEHFVTLKLKNNQEDFRRYVELTFNSYAKQYLYFSGNKRAYRDFSRDHWIIRVEGHKLLPVGKGFEKTKVRRKYIFNLKNYSSIDEAIRDMTNRVTTLKTMDLGIFIESTNDKVINLPVHLKVKRIYKTNRTLRGVIKGSTTANLNLNTIILPTLYKSNLNLTTIINPVEYIPTTTGLVDFNFSGAGDTTVEADDANFLFDLEKE